MQRINIIIYALNCLKYVLFFKLYLVNEARWGMLCYTWNKDMNTTKIWTEQVILKNTRNALVAY